MKDFHQNLLDWYAQFGRLDLPWRNLPTQSSTPHPKLIHINRAYGVYISEIMLQQTQVSVVKERFYFPFLERFPTLISLAEAQEEEVLKAWQGLGYYSRARNLQKSARECIERFNSTLPANTKDLKSLSGIGDYTAGAIACFGYGEAVSFVDGNIARILSRLFALPSPTPNFFKQKAQEILNLNHPFDHNQALLDLGATLCTPKNPNCLFCPLSEFCLGKSSPSLFPTPKRSLLTPLELHLGFAKKGEKISLLKSTQKLYYGLYNPINLEQVEDKDVLLGKFSHHYTRYKIEAFVYLCDREFEGVEYFSAQQIQSLPLSNLCKKALRFL